MSWHFNADYESWLFKDSSKYEFLSSKENQEFEHLIPFLESEPIYTTRHYDSKYIKKVEELTDKEFKTTQDRSSIKGWWCAVGDKERDRFLHSKATSNQLAIELGLVHGKLVNENSFSPKEGFLYKGLGELSGKGHFIWPRDQKRILHIIKNGGLLIEEPLRERVMDFSSLVLESGKAIYYKNLVDSRFQYRGTVLEELNWSLAPLKNYRQNIAKVADYYFSHGAKGPFSIDSYLFREDGEVKLCLISEVNVRKTMGYVAFKLAKLFQSINGAFLLSNSKSYDGLLEENALAIELSPEENRLKAVFVPAKAK